MNILETKTFKLFAFQILGVGPEHEGPAPVEGEGGRARNISGVSRRGCGLSGERGLQVDGAGPAGGQQWVATKSVVLRRGRRPRVPPDEEWLLLAVPSVGFENKIFVSVLL